ncbi:MAG: DUF4129 domain-containing protein [Spirochaetota bacterium]
MSSSRFKPELYRTVIHPLMSISVSSTGVLAVIWMVGANFGQAGPRAGTVAGVFVATILEAIAGNLLFKERMGVANRLRELVILLAAIYGLFSLAEPGPLAERFAPGFGNTLPVLAVGFAWLVAFAFHDRLRGREQLLRTLHGKRGAELRRAVLDHQHEMAHTIGQLRKARGLIGGMFVTLCVLGVLGTLDFLGMSVLSARSGAFLFLVLYGIASIASIGSLNTFIDEYAANGEGLSVPVRFQRRRSLVATAMIAMILVLAFALSRAESLLPIEAIGDFFRWLAGLFERTPDEMTEMPYDLPQTTQNPPPDMSELFAEEAEGPPLWLRILARLFERLAISVLTIVGVVLLFGPLFSPAFRKALAGLKPGQFIAGLFANLRRRLRVVGRLLRAILRTRRRRPTHEEVEAEPLSEAWREQQWKPNLRKRRQMDRVVQVFVDITRWGRRRNVTYSRSEAAQEYLRRVAEIVPERYADAVFVAETFCEARFSKHLIPRATMREYVQAAKRITATERV